MIRENPVVKGFVDTVKIPKGIFMYKAVFFYLQPYFKVLTLLETKILAGKTLIDSRESNTNHESREPI